MKALTLEGFLSLQEKAGNQTTTAGEGFIHTDTGCTLEFSGSLYVGQGAYNVSGMYLGQQGMLFGSPSYNQYCFVLRESSTAQTVTINGEGMYSYLQRWKDSNLSFTYEIVNNTPKSINVLVFLTYGFSNSMYSDYKVLSLEGKYVIPSGSSVSHKMSSVKAVTGTYGLGIAMITAAYD